MMIKRVFLLTCFLLTVSLTVNIPANAVEGQPALTADADPSAIDAPAVFPSNIQWQANPNVEGVQSAIVVGDPSGSELYALVGKMAAEVVFPAHRHPDNRIKTVISGVMYYGSGEQFDTENIQAYPAGSVVYTPAGVPHYMWAQEGEIIVQETGFGPTGFEFIAEVEGE
ncbi:MAG: cupin domain-containing protein [Cyanobacteria bacterium J06635_1]